MKVSICTFCWHALIVWSENVCDLGRVELREKTATQLERSVSTSIFFCNVAGKLMLINNKNVWNVEKNIKALLINDKGFGRLESFHYKSILIILKHSSESFRLNLILIIFRNVKSCLENITFLQCLSILTSLRILIDILSMLLETVKRIL